MSSETKNTTVGRGDGVMFWVVIMLSILSFVVLGLAFRAEQNATDMMREHNYTYESVNELIKMNRHYANEASGWSGRAQVASRSAAEHARKAEVLEKRIEAFMLGHAASHGGE